MKTIVQTGPESVEVQTRERPSPETDEVLIRVHAAGLCGSDAHAYKYDDGYEWIPIPRIMGHEYAGEVVEVGDDVTGIDVGDPVVEEPIHTCGSCFQCKNGQSNVCQNFQIKGMHCDGAYAEYTTAPAEYVHTLPNSIDLEHASITEPTSIAARAVCTQSVIQPGDSVLVEGPGPIGILVATVADAIGADVVVSGLGKDTAYRLPLVEELGLNAVEITDGELGSFVASEMDGGGFDVVFDTTGHKTGVEMGVEYVRKGGQIVVVGLPGSPSEIFMTPVVRGEIDLNTSYGSTWRNFEQAIQLIDTGEMDVETIIDISYTVTEPVAAFEAFLQSETCKPVFSFDET